MGSSPWSGFFHSSTYSDSCIWYCVLSWPSLLLLCANICLCHLQQSLYITGNAANLNPFSLKLRILTILIGCHRFFFNVTSENFASCWISLCVQLTMFGSRKFPYLPQRRDFSKNPLPTPPEINSSWNFSTSSLLWRVTTTTFQQVMLQ